MRQVEPKLFLTSRISDPSLWQNTHGESGRVILNVACAEPSTGTAAATSLRLDPKTEERLEQLAHSIGRTKAWLIRRAIDRAIEEYLDQCEDLSHRAHAPREGRRRGRHLLGETWAWPGGRASGARPRNSSRRFRATCRSESSITSTASAALLGRREER